MAGAEQIMTSNLLMPLRVLLLFLLFSPSAEAFSRNSETWSCEGINGNSYKTSWYIANGQMFDVRGEKAYTILMNTSSVAAAYFLVKSSDNRIGSELNILDKTSGKLVFYSDFRSNQGAGKPVATESVCERK